jgi:hypothetical protein
VAQSLEIDLIYTTIALITQIIVLDGITLLK